jgi:ectoine hydroxylase-related dioxygenase (phytanoyl-CoA dioxygenase family)
MHADFQTNGFAIFENMLDRETIDCLRTSVDAVQSSTRGGARNLFRECPVINDLAHSEPMATLASQLICNSAFPVRATLFDKSDTTNWLVPWHQDTAIAVQQRVDTPGFGGWSSKQEVVHVHAPASVLEKMVALRVHLDDCHEENGPLRVFPRSHENGKLDTQQIDRWKMTASETVCCVRAGGILAMRPLLLHASSRASKPARRRVIHIDYACEPLPHGLQWFEQPATILN